MRAYAAAIASLGLAACTTAEPHERVVARSVERVPAVLVSESTAVGAYRAAGTVRASRRAELSTRVTGRIEAVRVRAGDQVRGGQVLVTIERGSLSASEGQAASALELARTSLRRTERLYADSAMTLQQLEGARNAYAQAEAQARAVAADLTYTSIRAPFDGVIASRLVDPGTLAAPGQTLLVIEDRTAREIVVTAPDDVGARLLAGQEVAVSIGASGRRYSARVTAVVPGADPRSPTVEVRLRGPASLAPGLAAVAELPTAEQRALSVPRSALVERGQLCGVYLFAADSTMRLRWVRVGRSNGESVEVVSGLFAGDTVALDAARARDGLSARPVLRAPED
jgi:RND family efflux transporter MFP subunit